MPENARHAGCEIVQKAQNPDTENPTGIYPALRVDGGANQHAFAIDGSNLAVLRFTPHCRVKAPSAFSKGKDQVCAQLKRFDEGLINLILSYLFLFRLTRSAGGFADAGTSFSKMVGL